MLRDHTSDVPDEIFWRFFDEWSFADLQSALRVSVRWRRLLLDHPSYWRSITLDVPTPGAAALFILRMIRAEMRPVLVIINIPTSWEALTATVFPALRGHGSHIESLCVTVHAADAPDVLRCFDVPFPLLRRFRFIVRMADCVPNRAVLPRNLFLEQAHVLEDVLLRDVDLPLLPVPALGCAWSVFFAQGSGRSLPYPLPDLFCHFPKMTHFSLGGATTFADPSFYDLEKWGQIRVFQYNGYCYLLQPLLTRSQPLASIRCVHMGNADSFIADSLFAHLSGLLELVVLDTEQELVGTFETCLMDERHIVRSFREISQRWEKRESIDRNWIDQPDLAMRLLSLCISNTIWDRVVPFLPSPLPSLAELRIIMEPEPDRRDMPSSSSCSIACPRLQRVIIRSEMAVALIDPVALQVFAGACLHGYAGGLDLVLEGTVSLDPYTASLGGFGRVITQEMDCWWYAVRHSECVILSNELTQASRK